MSYGPFTESVVAAALPWLEELGYAVMNGPDIAAGEPSAERSDPHYRDLVPKILISGELWVKDAERYVENVQ